MHRSLVAFILTCFLATSVFARPASLDGHIRSREPLGRGELHKLTFHVYSAQFWTDGDTWDKSKPYALYIKYFRKISREKFLKSTLKELRRNPNVTEEMLVNYERKLGFIYPDVIEGDSITALYTPDEGILFCHNENKLGWMKDPELIVPFYEIWLGKHTSEPKLRKKLLNKKKG